MGVAVWFVAETGDFNGDGKSDILWRSGSNGTPAGVAAIWFMNGATISQSAQLGDVSYPFWETAATASD